MGFSLSDVGRVEAIALLAQRLGMRVSAIIVGDVKLILSEAWPAKSEQQAQTREVKEDRAQDPELEKLRAAGWKEFRRKLPDDLLRELGPLLGA